jgi:hypothetical protein
VTCAHVHMKMASFACGCLCGLHAKIRIQNKKIKSQKQSRHTVYSRHPDAPTIGEGLPPVLPSPPSSSPRRARLLPPPPTNPGGRSPAELTAATSTAVEPFATEPRPPFAGSVRSRVGDRCRRQIRAEGAPPSRPPLPSTAAKPPAF